MSQEFHLVFAMRSGSVEAREVQRRWFIAVCSCSPRQATVVTCFPGSRDFASEMQERQQSSELSEREDSKFRHGIKKEGADE